MKPLSSDLRECRLAAVDLDRIRAAIFLAYIEQVLAPALRPCAVVVFDSLISQFAPGAAEAIGLAGARVLLLSPYSQDFSPIEEKFSKLNECLRPSTARTRDSFEDALGERLDSGPPPLECGPRPSRLADSCPKCPCISTVVV